MRRFLSTLAFCAALNANAQDFEVDGFYYNITSLENLTVALTWNEDGEDYLGNPNGFGTYSGDIVVPRSVDWNGRTFVVNEIQGEAFVGCTLSSLVVPETVDYMYIGGARITDLVIEDGQDLLHASKDYQEDPNEGDEYGMIGDCEIENLYLGRNTPSRTVSTGIRKVTFGQNVTEVSDYMFSTCGITGLLILPEHIRRIGNYAFARNENLTGVQAPGVESMGMCAFEDCGSLADIQMPSLRYIGPAAFKDCVSLTAFEIPKGASGVGACAFEGCTALEAVTIPNSMIHFGKDVYLNTNYNRVFAGCTALKSVTTNATSPFELSEEDFDALTFVNATLRVPSGAGEAYRNASGWKNFFNIEESGASDDGICAITLKDSYGYYGGCIMVGSDTLDYFRPVIVQKGEAIVLKCVGISDSEGEYVLTRLAINGEDVTGRVVGNELPVEVSGNMLVESEWDYVGHTSTLLTVMQAEDGCLKMAVNEWDTYQFYVEPSDGWKIHSVTFNGEDITQRVGADGLLVLSGISENSVLSVAFEQSGTSVAMAEGREAKVYGGNSRILVSGAEAGSPVAIYNDSGILVRTFKASGGIDSIPMERGGIYIVKLNGKTVKMAL